MTVSIFHDRRQLEGHSFETARHIDKQLSDASSKINTLQSGINLGPPPKGGFPGI